MVDKRTSKSTTQTTGKEKVPTSVRGRGQSKDSSCGRGSRDTHDRGEVQDDGGDEGDSGGGRDMDTVSVSSLLLFHEEVKTLRRVVMYNVLPFNITEGNGQLFHFSPSHTTQVLIITLLIPKVRMSRLPTFQQGHHSLSRRMSSHQDVYVVSLRREFTNRVLCT